MVSRTTDTARISFEYDYENMLKKITFPDWTTNEFYNCTCGTTRTVKIDSTGFSSFFFEEHNGIEHILQEYDQSDVLKAEYTLGPGIDEIISRKTAQGTIYYHYNSLGSVTMLTDETGNLIGKYEYDAFGQILSKPEGITNSFTFTGREYDEDSGLYFYRARYYDASVGRFLTRDPQFKTISTSPPAGCGVGRGGVADIYNPSDLHPYVYVRNNPVNRVDPTGMQSGLLVCYAEMTACTYWANSHCKSKVIAAAQRGCNDSLEICKEWVKEGLWNLASLNWSHELIPYRIGCCP